MEPGTVDESEVVAEKVGVGDVERNAHAVIAGLGARVADGRLVGDGAGPGNRAGAGEDGLEKRGLAAQVWANECDAAGADAPIGP